MVKDVQCLVNNIDIKSLGNPNPKNEQLREFFDLLTTTKNDFYRKRKEVKQLVFIYASEDSDGC